MKRQGPNLKRKRTEASSEASRKRPKWVQAHDARVISAQTSGKAFGNGELDVEKFVRARDFEIKALEDGMRRAKKTLSTRAFQIVPRDLRRRTASHNAKRVPKRLRSRAVREMREDNTPTITPKARRKSSKMRLRLDNVKRLGHLGNKSHGSKGSKSEGPQEAGSLMDVDSKTPVPTATSVSTREPRVKRNKVASPAIPKAKFRKRQIHKAWLPTHIFHAKRAHMTPPKEPLWRLAIPLSPTAKSYRPTHRAASSRGALAWDMSYMSTILLEGPQESISKLLGDLGVGHSEPADFWTRGATKWMQGSRYWDGWLYKKNGSATQSIAPVSIVWRGQDHSVTLMSDVDRQQGELGTKSKRQVFVRIHPSAFLEVWEESLRSAKRQRPAVTLQDLRFEIGSIDIVGPASTEVLTSLLRPLTTSLQNEDYSNDSSKLWSLLRSLSNPSTLPPNVVMDIDATDPRLDSKPSQTDQQSDAKRHQDLLKALVTWPLDKSPPRPRLFDRASRMEACRRMPSQKAVNRRKAAVPPGGSVEVRATDPKIPCLLLASRGPGSGQGTWTLMLPWKCVLPMWYCLMHLPISTGGTIRFGGLNEKRQTLFETGTPWFPGDFPGSTAGMMWEEAQQEVRKREWEGRPKGKRVEWNSLDLGSDKKGEIGLGWACDWQRLVQGDGEPAQGAFLHLPPGLSRAAMQKEFLVGKHSSRYGLATIRIDMLMGGVPTTCARIYRLPREDTELRRQWLLLLTRQGSARAQKPRKGEATRLSKDAPKHIRQQMLAADLLQGTDARDDRKAEQPRVPGEEDLIGFVTTGNFNLCEGRGMAIGAVLLERAYEERVDTEEKGLGGGTRLCIVRNAGHSVGRLARWKCI